MYYTLFEGDGNQEEVTITYLWQLSSVILKRKSFIKKKSRFPVRVIEFLHSKRQVPYSQGQLPGRGRKLLVLESVPGLSNGSNSKQPTNSSEK